MIPQRLKSTAAHAAILAASAFAPPSSQAGWRNVGEFEYATIHVERNATDGDTEIVMTAKPLSELGVKTLSVLSPRWRKVVEVVAPARSGGLRELLFETPEPDASAILESYPEGSYLFFGIATNGRHFLGAAELSHELPVATTILAPTQDREVPLGPLAVQWARRARRGAVHLRIRISRQASRASRCPRLSSSRTASIKSAWGPCTRTATWCSSKCSFRRRSRCGRSKRHSHRALRLEAAVMSNSSRRTSPIPAPRNLSYGLNAISSIRSCNSFRLPPLISGSRNNSLYKGDRCAKGKYWLVEASTASHVDNSNG
jgi:hypothetical protein